MGCPASLPPKTLGIKHSSTNGVRKKNLLPAKGLLVEETRETLVNPGKTRCETRIRPPPNRNTLVKPCVTPEGKPGVKPMTMVPTAS